jgi:hypothetical protein
VKSSSDRAFIRAEDVALPQLTPDEIQNCSLELYSRLLETHIRARLYRSGSGSEPARRSGSGSPRTSARTSAGNSSQTCIGKSIDAAAVVDMLTTHVYNTTARYRQHTLLTTTTTTTTTITITTITTTSFVYF